MTTRSLASLSHLQVHSGLSLRAPKWCITAGDGARAHLNFIFIPALLITSHCWPLMTVCICTALIVIYTVFTGTSSHLESSKYCWITLLFIAFSFLITLLCRQSCVKFSTLLLHKSSVKTRGCELKLSLISLSRMELKPKPALIKPGSAGRNLTVVGWFWYDDKAAIWRKHNSSQGGVEGQLQRTRGRERTFLLGVGL